MLENAISNLKDGIENTIRRYPIAVAVALLATLLSWYAIQVENRSHYPDRREYLSSIFLLIALCSVAMPVVFSAHVIYNTGKRIAAIAIFAALPLLLWFFSWRVGYKIDTEYDVLLYFLWSAAGHFLAAIAAFWHADQLNGFWQWNKQLFLRFLTSGLYSSVLYLGIAGAILAVRLLFDWKMPDEVFAYLFVTIGVLFQSMFFLGGLSAPIEDLQHETDYPKGLKIFTQYVLLPLLGVYFVILYLYMGKIIVQFALPKGSVCFLILGFSVVGILSILLLHPLLDDENEAKWVRVVGKFFYFLLLPLTVLMFISIGVRLGDYGVTPNRYIMLLLAFWLFATCLYFIFSKKRNIIVIPASLMLISFFCSFGPWSVMQVSVRSQTAILKQLFIDNKLMKNDTLCALSKTQDTSVKDTLLKGTGRRIESILVALEEMGEMGTVKKWIPKTWQKAVFRDANNFDITVLQDKLNVDFAANVFEEIDRAPIASGDYHHAECIKHDLQNSIETYNFKRIWAFSQNGSAAGDLISSETEGNTLTFKTNEAEYKVDLTPFLADLMKTGSFEVATHVDVPAKNMIINGNGFKILVSSCAFNSKDETNTLSNISGVFLFNK